MADALAGYGARFVRYLSVGTICAATTNAIMIAGGLLHANYALSFAVAYLIVMPLGYRLHVRYTFATRPAWRGLVRYAGANLIGTLVSFAMTALFISGFGLPVAIAAPLVTIQLFVWNFVATHWAILAAPARSRRA